MKLRMGVPMALAVLALVLVWFVGRDANPGPLGFRLDDAWILAVYGQRLAEDGFLSYVPGVPSTGCTSPLWAAVLALIHTLVGDASGTDAFVTGVMVTSGLFHVGTAAYAGDLVGRLTRQDLTGAVAGGLVAVATPMAAAAFSGMEVVPTGLLLLAGAGAAMRGRWAMSGIALTFAALSRPESASVALVVAAFAALDSNHLREAAGRLLRLGLPLAVGAAMFIGYDLWASGAPFPATFYAKKSARLLDLPRRWQIASQYILPMVPPLGLGFGWLAVLGFVPRRRDGASRAEPSLLLAVLPLIAGLAYITANLSLIHPIDPFAFYHQRYLLPAIPLILVGLTIGAWRLGRMLPEGWAPAPLGILAAASILQAALTVGPESRHLHNDVRNINEVQRELGEWLGAHLPPDTWIAASDAGAIRYFSGLPTIDVLGLNTPEMLQHDETFIREHPVALMAIMPVWVYPRDSDAVWVVHGATTQHYSVTSDPRMATQMIIRANPKLPPAEDGSKVVRIAFDGVRSFELDFKRSLTSKENLP